MEETIGKINPIDQTGLGNSIVNILMMWLYNYFNNNCNHSKLYCHKITFNLLDYVCIYDSVKINCVIIRIKFIITFF